MMMLSHKMAISRLYSTLKYMHGKAKVVINARSLRSAIIIGLLRLLLEDATSQNGPTSLGQG